MDPISGVVQAGLGIATFVASTVAAARTRTEADEAMRAASEAFNIPLPELQQMVAQTLGPSAMQGVNADPNAVGAQYDAMGALQGISDSGGLTPEDQVNNNELQRSNAQHAMNQRQSIQNVLARSGQGNSGVSAALQLGAARDSQEAGALAGAKTAADARRRATEAVLQRGQLGGQMRQQGFNEGTAKAQAADRIAQYNAQATERAQRYNLGLPQQQYDNQMSRAAGRAAVERQMAEHLTGNADRTQRTISDFGAGVGKTFQGVYDSATNKSAQPTTTYEYPGYTNAPQRMDEEEYP